MSRRYSHRSMPGTAFALALLSGLAAVAQPAIFQIDPDRSQVTVSGQVIGMTLREQGPGSLTSRFQGSIQIESAGSSIVFPGGSFIIAQTNGNWAPRPGGTSGAAPANFGAQASSFVFGTVLGAIRNATLDIASDTLELENGAFDASALLFSFPADSTASLDYSSTVASSSQPLAGNSASNLTATGSLTVTNGLEQLVIEIEAEYRLTLLAEGDSKLRLVGKLVATREIPPEVVTTAVAGDQFVLEVIGATTTSQVQSSTNLIDWNTKAAERTAMGDRTSFAVETSGVIEFFRIVK